MFSEEKKFEVRDLRKKSKFVVDDEFLNGYARFLDIYTVGVYNSLCRHVDKNQKCFPSIKKIGEKLNISKNKIIESIKKLVFWNIIKKQRIGLKCTNRYTLLDEAHWLPLNKENLKQFSEAYHKDFKGLLDKLQKFTERTSIVRKHNSKETQKKGCSSFSFKELADAYKKGSGDCKPYFWGNPMRWSQNCWWIIENGAWLEFAGLEAEIEWK